MPLALSYDEVKSLAPCDESFRRVAKLLGGKKGWNGNRIDAATARAAGCSFGDLVWVTGAIARTDKDVKRRLRLWMADCAARVLHIYEKTESSAAPRDAIIAARAFARGEIDDTARDTAWDTARDTAWAAAGGAAWDTARDTAWDAAWDTAWDAEEAWQFDRLVEWLSEIEPEDYPLPDRAAAA